MINFIKYLLWQRKKSKRIKYPKDYKCTNMPNDIMNAEFQCIVNYQKDIKDKTGKYFTIDECYNLVMAYNGINSKIMEAVK